MVATSNANQARALGIELRQEARIVIGQGFLSLSDYLRADLYPIAKETYDGLKAEGSTSIWANDAGSRWFLLLGPLNYINERASAKIMLKWASNSLLVWVTGNHHALKSSLSAGMKLWIRYRRGKRDHLDLPSVECFCPDDHADAADSASDGADGMDVSADPSDALEDNAKRSDTPSQSQSDDSKRRQRPQSKPPVETPAK